MSQSTFAVRHLCISFAALKIGKEDARVLIESLLDRIRSKRQKFTRLFIKVTGF